MVGPGRATKRPTRLALIESQSRRQITRTACRRRLANSRVCGEGGADGVSAIFKIGTKWRQSNAIELAAF